jgi:hypothetical protein
MTQTIQPKKGHQIDVYIHPIFRIIKDLYIQLVG